MRKQYDLCLLCRTMPADKKNSHILPRFISTSFLKGKDGVRKGFEIGELEPNKKTRIIQDSPKEDFILCSDCEMFFSIIEGLAADSFSNWQKYLADGTFNESQVFPGHLSLVNWAPSSALYSRLLVYSMFWRASISSHKLFENYYLIPTLEESLRTNLLSIKAITKSGVIANISTANFTSHPYGIITSRHFQDSTANSIAAISDQVPAALNVDKFGFLIFPSEQELEGEFIGPFCNITITDHRIMVLGEDLWQSVMVERLMYLAARQKK